MSRAVCATRSRPSAAPPGIGVCNGISRLPAAETAETRKRFKTCEIGYVHIDSCELRHADGKMILFLAIDRLSTCTSVALHDSAGKMEGFSLVFGLVVRPMMLTKQEVVRFCLHL